MLEGMTDFQRAGKDLICQAGLTRKQGKQLRHTALDGLVQLTMPRGGSLDYFSGVSLFFGAVHCVAILRSRPLVENDGWNNDNCEGHTVGGSCECFKEVEMSS